MGQGRRLVRRCRQRWRGDVAKHAAERAKPTIASLRPTSPWLLLALVVIVVITVPVAVWISDIHATIRSAVPDVGGWHLGHWIDPDSGRPSCRYASTAHRRCRSRSSHLDLAFLLVRGSFVNKVVYELDRPTIRVVGR
jgi:hypothetical protein